jgi:hypothetical protein
MNNLSLSPIHFAPQIINHDLKIQKSGQEILANVQQQLVDSAPEMTSLTVKREESLESAQFITKRLKNIQTKYFFCGDISELT